MSLSKNLQISICGILTWFLALSPKTAFSQDTPHIPPLVEHSPPVASVLSSSARCRDGRTITVQAKSVLVKTAEVVLFEHHNARMLPGPIAEMNDKIKDLRGIKNLELSCSSRSDLLTLEGFETLEDGQPYARRAFIFISKGQVVGVMKSR